MHRIWPYDWRFSAKNTVYAPCIYIWSWLTLFNTPLPPTSQRKWILRQAEACLRGCPNATQLSAKIERSKGTEQRVVAPTQIKMCKKLACAVAPTQLSGKIKTNKNLPARLPRRSWRISAVQPTTLWSVLTCPRWLICIRWISDRLVYLQNTWNM